jgi:hypothetical protein
MNKNILGMGIAVLGMGTAIAQSAFMNGVGGALAIGCTVFVTAYLLSQVMRIQDFNDYE